MTDRSAYPMPLIAGLALAATVFAGGCASTDSGILGSGAGVTASDPSRMTQSGFLSNYARLEPAPWGDGIIDAAYAEWQARLAVWMQAEQRVKALQVLKQRALDRAAIKQKRIDQRQHDELVELARFRQESRRP